MLFRSRPHRSRSCRCCPRVKQTEGLSVQSISWLTHTALASAVYASRETLPLPCKTCFRLAGCAFSGRVSNPLDHCRRFLATFPSSFSGLCLTLAQLDCNQAACRPIMGCGRRQVVHCPSIHRYLLVRYFAGSRENRTSPLPVAPVA